MVLRHVEGFTLYRIFYYDCPPLEKKVHHPLTGKCLDYSKSDTAHFRREFIDHLKKKRKVAIRLGHLSQYNRWIINPERISPLIKGNMQIDELQENDFIFDVKQKGVDMKIGIDIASLAYKKQVGRIILVAGDNDFIPAAKLARREGIDFILDPMWMSVSEELHEHVDGIQSKWDRPGYKKKT